MTLELDRDRLDAVMTAVADRLEGEWLLLGGALVALWVEPRRVTQDIDIVGLSGTPDERYRLMRLADELRLPVETVNSAADFFVRRIEGWRDEIVLFRTGTRGRVYRPTPTLFLLLKAGRLSEQDLADCLAVIDKSREEGLAIDVDRVQAFLASLALASTGAQDRRERLAHALMSPGETRARIHGVDFSGAIDPAQKTWIASGTLQGNLLSVDECRSLADLPPGEAGADDPFGRLRSYIETQPSAAFGLDFPFGLPAPLVEEDGWDAFIRHFRDRFPDPQSFRKICRAASQQEMKRLTDDRVATPFSPYNLRMYKQTYYGIRDVLAPLVETDRVSVPPMRVRPGSTILVEICPASTLKAMADKSIGSYKRGAKGSPEEQRAARETILGSFEAARVLRISSVLRTKILSDREGDALDSVIAALATARALQDGFAVPADGRPLYLLEGYVFT